MVVITQFNFLTLGIHVRKYSQIEGLRSIAESRITKMFQIIFFVDLSIGANI